MGDCVPAKRAHWVIEAFGKEMEKTFAIEFPESWKVRQFVGYDEPNRDVRMFVAIRLPGKKRSVFLMQEDVICSCMELELGRLVDVCRRCGIPDEEIKKRIEKYGHFEEEELEGIFDE